MKNFYFNIKIYAIYLYFFLRSLFSNKLEKMIKYLVFAYCLFLLVIMFLVYFFFISNNIEVIIDIINIMIIATFVIIAILMPSVLYYAFKISKTIDIKK